jgi:hypothetical protein
MAASEAGTLAGVTTKGWCYYKTLAGDTTANKAGVTTNHWQETPQQIRQV